MAEYDNPRPSSQPEGSTDLAVAKDNLITLDKMLSGRDDVTNRKGKSLPNLQAVQQGGYIVFATLALLNANGTPDDIHAGFKVATGTGSGYYHWDGSAYVFDDALVENVIDVENTSDGVSGFAVSQAIKFKADLEITSDQLFNKETVTSGYYVDNNQDGALVVSDGSGNVSDFIPVQPSANYSGSPTSFASFYDSSFDWVAGGWRNVITTSFTAPSSASYIRVTVDDDDLDAFNLHLASVVSSDVEYKTGVPAHLLGDVYDSIATVDAKYYTNDWYDPDLQLPHTLYYGGSAVDSVNYMLSDFSTYNEWLPRSEGGVDYGRYLCGIATSAVKVDLFFSSNFLINTLGYSVGDKIKLGFWYRFPSATSGNTRRLYTSPDTFASAKNVTIADSDWHWHEEEGEKLLTADDWQKWYVAYRDTTSATEELHVRGVTIVNLDKDTWIGELKSDAIADANDKNQVLNLNPFVEYIPDNVSDNGVTPQMGETYDHAGYEIIKSVETVAEPIVGDCFVFEGVTATQAKINFVTSPISSSVINNFFLLPANFKNKYFSQTMYVKVDTGSVVDTFTFIPSNNTSANENNYAVSKIPTGEWVKLSTVPVKLVDSSDLESLKSRVQIGCTPTSGSAVVRICGLTTTISDSPLLNRVIMESYAHSSIFYGKEYVSYGDSITAGGDYARFVAGKHGMKSIVRGIGGTTVANNGSTAWVDADGNYLDRPPSAEPDGVEGVDWFTIKSGMATQERVDTLPTDCALITMMGGTNDYGQNVLLGTINDEANSEAGSPTFYGAYKSALDKIQLRCPNARIIMCNITSINNGDSLTPNTAGFSVEDYRNAVRDIAKLYGLPLFESNELGINASNHSRYSSDGTHPNNSYYALIGNGLSRTVSKLDYDEVKDN